MKITVLIREAVRSAAASKVPTALVAFLVAAMCLTTLLTVGRAAAAQEQVQARLEGAGSRLLAVTDVKGGEFISASVIDLVAGLSTVERAVGLSLPSDVTNTAIGGGTPVPAWNVVGSLADAVELTSGRWPRPGEALVAADAQGKLGLMTPVGAVAAMDETEDWAVVGAFRARAPFTSLNAGVVIAAPPTTAAHTLNVVATDASTAKVTQSTVVSLLARHDPDELSVMSPASLAELQGEVVGDLARYNRSMLVAVMAAGALLVGVVAAADVLIRRRDLGRRRALGAPRWALTTLVVVRTGCGALLGAVLASILGLLLAGRAGYVVPLPFVAGTAILGVLAAAVSSIPPAFAASRQDPVRVLRTP